MGCRGGGAPQKTPGCRPVPISMNPIQSDMSSPSSSWLQYNLDCPGSEYTMTEQCTDSVPIYLLIYSSLCHRVE
ncbi:hypothetical protein Y1Q_0002128 [Alligator mississippiensis]|uniref:Uncharacterized protein n=1 Tax=Alligator mississippiensis TaxID=8496 RepID=A0A151MPN6_ALLMI|nr:hypothetical protein Y1Q_0002128 [Alligator mississippiensis]